MIRGPISQGIANRPVIKCFLTAANHIWDRFQFTVLIFTIFYSFSGIHIHYPGRGARPKPDMSRQSQTESAYVQTVPGQKKPMSRPSKTECAYVKTIVRSKIISAFFVRSKSNMSRPSQTKSVYVQIFVRSCPDHRALQIKFVRSNSKVLLRSCPDHRAFMSRLSCVQQTEKTNYILCSVIPWR